MKNLKVNALALGVILAGFFSACEKPKDAEPDNNEGLELKKIENLEAPGFNFMKFEPLDTPFVKFSFAKGDTTSGDDWDIAFKSFTIIVNGGATKLDEVVRTGNAAAALVTGVFNETEEVSDTITLKQDAATEYAIPSDPMGEAWFNYDQQAHILSPQAGKFFIIRTHDNKYVKLEILSFYKDAPANPQITDKPEVYTFQYKYQPDGSKDLK